MAPESGDNGALERIRVICLGFSGAEEGELQGRPLFHVARRRFALFNGLASPPRRRWSGSGRSLHFLADSLEIDALRQDDRFTPSPHHGNRGWLAVRLEGAVDWEEIGELVESAYHQVVRRLPNRA
jgi:predicted DNA-binding protein (MmcQ/YjbR family)